MPRARPLPWVEPLSQRELEILRLMAEGLSNREVGDRLALSAETVKWYNKQLFSKLGVPSRSGAVAIADEYGLLETPGLPAEGRPRRDNLPAPLTSYVPRPREAAEIKRHLKTSRLVMLTGAGGTGKTRLALEVATELVGSYRDGVWWVELAPVGHADSVASALCRVFGLQASGDSIPRDTLKHFLERRHLLLVLDNFEHLLEAGPWLGELLSQAPQLAALVTSREPLHIYGEQELTVGPLPLPTEAHFASVEQLLANEAVDLFFQRARAVRPSLHVSLEQAAAAARICTRLDGLPLAIELAASQTDMFPPTMLAERIARDPWSLPSGPRDVPRRHRSLQAAIDWSYELLDEDEKVAFRRLSVFRSGAALESFEAVCRQDLPGDSVALLAALVRKNLVKAREDPPGHPRFTMLETIREYAAAHLNHQGETDAVRRAHASHFADLAEQADREFRGARNRYWLQRLRSEHQNFEAALEWSLTGAEKSYGLRTAAFLDDHWYYNGFLTDGRRWTDLAERHGESAPTRVRARLFRAIGNLAYALDDQERSRTYFQKASEIYDETGDEMGVAWCQAFFALGDLDSDEGIRQGSQMARRALETFQRAGNNPGRAFALNVLGELARLQGDDELARSYYEECLALTRETGEAIREAMQYENLGILAYRRGEFEPSRRLILRGLALSRQLGSTYGLASHLATLAGPVAALGRPREAARLLGAANAHLQALGTDQQPADQPDIRRFLESVVQSLGEDEFEAEWQIGQAMTLDEAVDWALEGETGGETPQDIESAG